MDLGLKNKNAAITGASQGIGEAVAHALANEGCNVAICARNKERLDQTVSELKAKGVKVTYPDPIPFRNASKAVYDEFVKSTSSKAILDEILGM